jgi:hypothetical protein
VVCRPARALVVRLWRCAPCSLAETKHHRPPQSKQKSPISAAHRSSSQTLEAPPNPHPRRTSSIRPVSGCPRPARPRGGSVRPAGRWSRAWPTSSASGASSGAAPSGRSTSVRAAGSNLKCFAPMRKLPLFPPLPMVSDGQLVCLAVLLQVPTCRPTRRSRLSW